jgi:predicted DNA-binding protein
MAKKETPKPFMVRLYKKQRMAVERLARKSKVSSAYIVRLAIEKLLDDHGML